MKKVKSPHPVKKFSMSLENSVAYCMLTTNAMKQSWTSTKNETENDEGDQSAGVEETKESPEFTIEEMQSATDRLKKKEKHEAWRRKIIKVIYKRVTWRMMATTAQYSTSVVQIVLKALVQKNLLQFGQRTTSRSGRVSTLISNSGSSGDVQIARTEMPRVRSQNVDSHSGLRESLGHDEAQTTVDRSRSFRCRTKLHQCL